MAVLDERREATAAPATRRWAGLLARPAIVVVVLLVLYLVVSAQELDSIERRSLNAAYILSRTWQHVQLTAIVSVLVLLIAVPVGVLLTREGVRRWSGPVLTVANVSQAIPSIGLIVLFAVAFVSMPVYVIAVLAFVIHGVLPIVRNTIAGLGQVDRSVIEAARGMGMSRSRVLFQVELPLAVPVILAGVRTTLTITTGTVALEAGADGTRMVTLASKRLHALYLERYRPADAKSDDADEKACREAVTEAFDGKPPAMTVWLDAKEGGLALNFDLAHAVQACADTVVIPAAVLRKEGAQAVLVDAIEAAHAAQRK